MAHCDLQLALPSLCMLQMVMGASLDTISKSSSLEAVLTILTYIIGVLFYTLLIGMVTGIVASMNITRQQYVDRLQIWQVRLRAEWLLHRGGAWISEQRLAKLQGWTRAAHAGTWVHGFMQARCYGANKMNNVQLAGAVTGFSPPQHMHCTLRGQVTMPHVCLRMQDYCQYRRIPPKMSKLVRKYLEAQHLRKRVLDDDEASVLDDDEAHSGCRLCHRSHAWRARSL